MGIYSGHKAQLLEGGVRVPAFIRWPGKIKANSSTQQVAITMDWTATILAIAGAAPHPDFPLDGQNLLEICTGKKQTFERTLYWRTFQVGNQKAMRDGNWKYLKTGQGEFLYDLAVDPSEKIDLKEKSPQMFEKLKSKYSEWEKTVLQPIPL